MKRLMQVQSLWLRDKLLLGRVEIARSMLERMRGLLGRAELAAGTGMLITRCGAVHTVGMQFALDLLFLDAELHVVRCVRDVKPGRLMVVGRGAKMTLEAEAGWLREGTVQVGDLLELRPLKNNQ